MKKVAISLVKNINSDIILNYLVTHPNVSISKISQDTGLSRPTITRTIHKGLAIGLIQETERRGEELGRKAQCYSFNQNHCNSLLLYVNKKTVFVWLIRLSGQKIFQAQFPVDEDRLPRQLHAIIHEQMTEFDNIQNVCVSLPGHITNGYIWASAVFPALNGTPLQKEIEEKYSVSAFVMDSVNMLTFSGYDFIPNCGDKNISFVYTDPGGKLVGALFSRGVNFPGVYGCVGDSRLLPLQTGSAQQNYTNFAQILITNWNPEIMVLYPTQSVDIKLFMKTLQDFYPPYILPEFILREDPLADTFSALKHVAFALTLDSVNKKAEKKETEEDPMQIWYNLKN